jgi:hypothetical protein
MNEEQDIVGDQSLESDKFNGEEIASSPEHPDECE